jgi:hypothetical protein
VVNSIGATGNIYSLTMNTGAAATSDDRRGLEQLSHLTPDDWAVVSASVGYKCGPDENGNLQAGQPLIAWTLAEARTSGELQGTLTSSYLQTHVAQGQAADYAQELSRAIDYLSAREDPNATWSGDPRRRELDVSA